MSLLANPAVANVAKSTLAFAIIIAVWQVVGQLTHAPEHVFPAAVNWNQGRAYYWSPAAE